MDISHGPPNDQNLPTVHLRSDLYLYIYIHIYCMLVYLDMYCEHVACRRPCERELSSVVSP